MFEGLDDIPWSSLHHAYGTAEDVPGQIRALATSGEEQKQALSDLFGNIWHQGTVYEASSYAVPFLVELVANPKISRRDEMLGLIGALADGNSYLDVHSRVDVLAKILKKDPEFEYKRSKELESVQNTHDATFQQRKVFIELLNNDSLPMVRAGAAHVLSKFGEAADAVAPVLRQSVLNEKDILARAAIIWCIGAIGDRASEAIQLLHHIVRNSRDPREECSAALALLRIGEKPDEFVVPVLNAMAASPGFSEGFLIGVPWDFQAEIDEEWLAEFAPDKEGASKMLLTVLANDDAMKHVSTCVVRDLLELNFPGGWRVSKTMTATQRHLLKRLSETDSAWQDTKRLWFLLPDKLKRLRDVTVADINAVRSQMRIMAGDGT
jgi:HEAT repeats